MSMTGFKKQINKANQFMNEKIGGAKGTELDEDFIAMEKQVDVLGRLVEELVIKTQEMLQPNPVSRSKMMAMKGVSKLRGQHNTLMYPQPEGLLGETMVKHGRDLSETSALASALNNAGESFKQLAEVKYQLEDTVRQNFIEPLHNLQTKDLKEVNFHRKKLTGRRLDYDCKKRKHEKDGTSVTEDEIAQAEEKFEESKQLAETAMSNLLENEVEQITQLISLVEAELTYHQQSTEILQSLLESLQTQCRETANRQKHEHVVKRVTATSRTTVTSSSSTKSSHSLSSNSDQYDDYAVERSTTSALTSGPRSRAQQACAEALYDFDAENDGELAFREGDKIVLLSRVDENWFEGSVNGRSGLFPVTYVNVLVDLP